jgi:hypothetical protein
VQSLIKNKCRTKDKCVHIQRWVVPHRDRKEEQYPNGRVTIRNFIKKSGRHLEKVDRIIGGGNEVQKKNRRCYLL